MSFHATVIHPVITPLAVNLVYCLAGIKSSLSSFCAFDSLLTLHPVKYDKRAVSHSNSRNKQDKSHRIAFLFQNIVFSDVHSTLSKLENIAASNKQGYVSAFLQSS